jgi:hypothetical protein
MCGPLLLLQYSLIVQCTHFKEEIFREMVETMPCCCWLCIPRTGGCEIINLVSTECISYVTSFLKLGNINGMKKKKGEILYCGRQQK